MKLYVPTSMYARAALKHEAESEAVVDLVVGDVLEIAANGFNVPSDDVEHLVDQVNAPVEKHSAAVLLGSAPVGRNTAASVDAGFDIDDLADLTGVVDLLHCEKIDVETAVLVNREFHAVFLRALDQSFERFERERYRLLHDNVFACVHARDSDFLMNVVRDCNGDKLDLLVCEKLLTRSVSTDPAALRKSALLGKNIVDSRERNDIAVLYVVDVPRAHSAVAYYRRFFHSKYLTAQRRTFPP